MSSQQGSFAHRSSLPFSALSQYGQTGRQPQQRSYSASQASSQDEQSIMTGHVNPQWRNNQGYTPGVSDYTWQQQQYTQAQADPQPTENINSIIGDIGGVLQYHSSNDEPWNAHQSQQHTTQLFNSEQYQTPGLGARTVVPDTRSQQGSFAHDSAYYSQSSHKRSAPSDEISPQFSEHLLSPPPALRLNSQK